MTSTHSVEARWISLAAYKQPIGHKSERHQLHVDPDDWEIDPQEPREIGNVIGDTPHSSMRSRGFSHCPSSFEIPGFVNPVPRQG